MTKNIWIVGGSTGMGAEAAKLYGQRGDKVVVSARSQDTLEGFVEGHENLTSAPLDITDGEAVGRVTAEIYQHLGSVDVAILNAGAWHLMDAAEMDLTKVRQAVEVNYLGTLNVIEALMVRMMKAGSGHIAIVASVAGFRGLPRSMAYGPTKAALINLAETLHTEFKPHGILVSVINPGFVDTPMTKDNPFPMPGIIPASEAARHIVRGLDAGKFEVAFPFAFVTVMKMLRILPNWAFFPIVKRML